jgi:hypothetical protein
MHDDVALLGRRFCDYNPGHRQGLPCALSGFVMPEYKQNEGRESKNFDYGSTPAGHRDVYWVESIKKNLMMTWRLYTTV